MDKVQRIGRHLRCILRSVKGRKWGQISFYVLGILREL